MLQVVSDSKEFQTILSENVLVVVDFYATWCGPCKRITPFLQKLSEKYESVKFLKIDVENEDLSQIAGKYKINAIPTFVFFANGEERSRCMGANEAVLEANLVSLLTYRIRLEDEQRKTEEKDDDPDF